MNQFTLLVVVLVAFCYFGGKYCPSALKKNKEILLGVAGGLVLCSFFGLRLEGLCVAGRREDGTGMMVIPEGIDDPCNRFVSEDICERVHTDTYVSNAPGATEKADHRCRWTGQAAPPTARPPPPPPSARPTSH